VKPQEIGTDANALVGHMLVCTAGKLPYEDSWSLQQALREARRRQTIPDLLLLVEHPPTYTLGRSSSPEHLLIDRATLKAVHGIDVFDIERGGSATYHGPGQLVGYPIIDLKRRGRDVHQFIRLLEEVLMRTLAEFNLSARTSEGLTGVWVADNKIASIGIHVRHWITMHGFALNVAPDLSHFQWIQPCGLDNKVITSMAAQLGYEPDLSVVAAAVTRQFAHLCQCSCAAIDVADLSALALSHEAPLETDTVPARG
jgi:lipoate-protein ligase B